VPSGSFERTPLLVALHGCTQTATDFASGTRFDEIAQRHGAYVLYPEQSARENSQRCWNWFMPEHQRRTRGEPAAILALVESVCREHSIDRERVFVAGLSAGAAMAAILAEQAPDIFAAAGMMAGVPLHASRDVMSAYALMKGDVINSDITPALMRKVRLNQSFERLRATIWTGAEDRRVAPSNASALTRQFLQLLQLEGAAAIRVERADAEVLRWSDAKGALRVEQWNVPHMGHAWSGGSFRGSHTHPDGPNASEEMFEFFLSAKADVSERA
jgi:poly(hydroxyalkanoate) depolymerase family esterase